MITAFKGGRIQTITNGIIEDGTVLVKDGKIAQIGQNLSADAEEMLNLNGDVINKTADFAYGTYTDESHKGNDNKNQSKK